jgi:hypothetical protein
LGLTGSASGGLSLFFADLLSSLALFTAVVTLVRQGFLAINHPLRRAGPP